MQLRYLNEYADFFTKNGEKSFREHFPGGALVGTGMIGHLSDRPPAWERRTLTYIDLDQVDEMPSVVGRVWRVRKTLVDAHRHQITLGRAYDNDIVVPEQTVSTHHCVFMFEPHRMRVADLESLNGTKLNGDLLDAYQSRPIYSGDAVTIGRVLVGYFDATAFVQRVGALARGQAA